MSKLKLILLCFLLSSCCGLHTEVKYEYNDVVITRVDVCGKTTFYYGNKQDERAGAVWVEYSGINDGFSGYLKFEDNGKVTLLSGDGNFKTKYLDTNQFEYKRISAYQRPEAGPSVYYVALSTKYEIENKKNEKTAVKAVYNIDESEWW